MLQPVIEKIGNSLPDWKNNFLSYPGRELLVKYVLSAMPSYFLSPQNGCMGFLKD
jgi:hypothetical protein